MLLPSVRLTEKPEEKSAAGTVCNYLTAIQVHTEDICCGQVWSTPFTQLGWDVPQLTLCIQLK